MSPKKRILVGMSGGVDSAVSAHLLMEAGYEVVAWFMKNYATDDESCTTRQDRDSAIKASQYLWIQNFVIFDFRTSYQERIIDYIYDTYERGLTPNPDVLCNNLIKFDLFAAEAKKRGFDGIATGHYARIIHDDSYHLLTGVDKNKDQSYFLSGLSQDQLAYAQFPLGELTKPEVRAIAQKIWLPNADRPDSQGLCFIGKVSMQEFLQKKLPVKEGKIINPNGKVIGTHPGAYFYTMGQSHHINVWNKAYVTKIDIENNILTVSENRDDASLISTTVTAKNLHRIQKPFVQGQKILAKIRYREETKPATVASLWPDTITIEFTEHERAVAPGQVLALYDGEEVRGNGIIC